MAAWLVFTSRRAHRFRDAAGMLVVHRLHIADLGSVTTDPYHDDLLGFYPLGVGWLATLQRRESYSFGLVRFATRTLAASLENHGSGRAQRSRLRDVILNPIAFTWEWRSRDRSSRATLDFHDYATVDLVLAHAAEEAVDVFKPLSRDVHLAVGRNDETDRQRATVDRVNIEGRTLLATCGRSVNPVTAFRTRNSACDWNTMTLTVLCYGTTWRNLPVWETSGGRQFIARPIIHLSSRRQSSRRDGNIGDGGDLDARHYCLAERRSTVSE